MVCVCLRWTGEHAMDCASWLHAARHAHYTQIIHMHLNGLAVSVYLTVFSIYAFQHLQLFFLQLCGAGRSCA